MDQFSLNARPRRNENMIWRHPTSNLFKLNVDAAVNSIGRNAAVGGLIRDSSGVCLDAFNFNIGSCSPLFAKIWAVQHDLKQLLQLGI